LILTESGKGNIFKANFFNRFGQFLLRRQRTAEAIEKFSIAYSLCVQDKFYGRFRYMLVSARYLRDLYRETGDYRNSLTYALACTHISDSLNVIMKKDQVITEAVKRERELRQLAAEKDRQKIRQGKTQRNMIAIGAGVLAIFILVVYRSYRNQKRLNRLLDEERQKSEQLLLNILPQETAEELKATGKARAKRFEEVTVMFTDFKNFTQASEKMSAEDLVSEINFYFSEFDRIISKHSIEKIKIIGDSYMCAGGLPVPNTTHPVDVVKAALELQSFILRQREERLARGESWFELRIGIHTGPVIAGIVGINKFAYDIWGDTVNTASRMESSGEPNKVNISGETYQRVQHVFRCTYRGKVAAKHKGEIDMYFVEPG
jgi:class 3 adenylate cyclase